MTHRKQGFTLIELLIVVAIIGIIAAVLIPNLLDALQKAKQKRTAADIRNTGTAWMSWHVDQIGAASAGALKIYDASGFVEVDYADLVTLLRPTDTFFYTQEVSQADGWNHPLVFCKSNDLLHSQVLCIGSGGRNGDLDSCAHTFNVRQFVATDYDQDIVWADGYFVQWPEGLGSESGS